MKRYIDVDEFKLPCKSEDCHECIFFSLNRCIMKEHINNSTITADMVEVVRCKDCERRTELPYVDKDTHEPIYDCGYNISAIWGEENGYCHHGKRRE